MAKKLQAKSFQDVLSTLGSQRFDVSPAQEGAGRRPGAFRVAKHGCAAEILGSTGGQVMLLHKPGWLLGGEISRIVDKGYQKFIANSRLQVPATAEMLRALHDFTQELDLATGEMSFYNDALGTTSDVYLYDRVAGRTTQP